MHYSDTTGSEATPVSKDAPAIPTPVITPVDAPAPAGESEKEAQEEEASISLQPPTEKVNFLNSIYCYCQHYFAEGK